MAWQERLFGWLERSGDWPDQTLEIVCMFTAIPFFIAAVAYGYFPFFFLGALFTAVAWVAEERRLGAEEHLLKTCWAVVKRSLLRPWWSVAGAGLIVLGVWREAVWMALIGLLAFRGAVRRGRSKPAPPKPDEEK